MRLHSNPAMRPWHLTTLLVFAMIAAQAHEAVAIPGPVADLSAGVYINAYPKVVVPGGTLDIQVGVANVGPLDAMNVALRVPVPAHTTFVSWSMSVLTSARATSITPPQGGTGTVYACIESVPVSRPMFNTVVFLLRVRVDPNEPQGATITANAIVPGLRTDDPLWCPTTTYDPVPANNTATDTVPVSGPADIAVTASAWTDSVVPDTDVTYTLEITNAGPYDAESVRLDDDIGPTRFVSFTQESGPAFTLDTSEAERYRVSASIGTLMAGTTARFTLVVHVPPFASNWDATFNEVRCQSATGDPDQSNNRFTAWTPIAAP
jgi:uncharacterized repeat protein (TIGR01451 family)